RTCGRGSLPTWARTRVVRSLLSIDPLSIQAPIVEQAHVFRHPAVMMWACSQILSLEGPRMRRIELFVLLALSSLLAGCGGETDEERLLRLVPDARATTPVSGTVVVDGAPVKDLWVTLHPKDSSFTFRPRGQTDGKGRFQIMTYSAGDGAPEG